MELSSIVIGVSTLVQKFGQEPPAVGTIIRLVSFLNKTTLVKFNYVSCNCRYRMNLPSPKFKLPYFEAAITKEVSRNFTADISVNRFGSVTAVLEMQVL